MRINAKDVLYKTLAILYRYAKDIAVLEYPRSIERRSIDLVVRLNDGRKALVKVTADISDIPRSEIIELLKLSASLGASPLIVARSKNGEELIPGVAYERSGITVVAPETIEGVLSGKDPVYIYESRESFRVKINPDKMREKRLDKGYSLGDLALRIKTSRKAVYEYEKGRLDPSVDKARILLNILGEDIVDEYEIFTKPKTMSQRKETFDSSLEYSIANVLEKEGFTIVHAKKTVVDIGGSKGEKKIVVVVRHPRESNKTLYEKGVYLSRMANIIGIDKKLAIVDNHSVAKDLEHEGLEIVYTENIDRLLEILGLKEKGEKSE